MTLAYFKRGKYQVDSQRFILGWGSALHSLSYLGMFLFTLTFVDASPIFETRLLLPIDISLLIIGMTLFAWLWAKRQAVVRAGITAVCVLFMLSLTQNAKQWVMDLHQAGQGFASQEWSSREIFNTVRQLPRITLYSNKTTAVYFFTNHPAYILASPVNPATGLPNGGYKTYVENVRASVLKGQAMVVVFDYDTLMTYPEDKEILTLLPQGLPVYKDFEKDIIFGRFTF